jgi:hypothetical protein
LWQQRLLQCSVLRVHPACPSLAVRLVFHTASNKKVQMRNIKSMKGPRKWYSSSPSPACEIHVQTAIDKQTKTNSVDLVREWTIPTEQPPLIGEVSANFCRLRGVA